ncbi:MAG: MazG nucleotide pyrophosphohydrolase domain-containing protein, partial [Pseudomonadota bacterium]
GDAKVKDYKTHRQNWTRLKQQEKPKKKILEGIPKALPALQLAQRYGEITSSVGFDWKKTSGVLKKVKEELKEFETEVKENHSKERMEEELGDLLFSLAQVARHLGLDAERSLKGSSLKFAHRFESLERKVKKMGKNIADMKSGELEKEWQTVKKSD